tara:strand:- start:369 stop:572 length:204 start_codon:yes stop_codon:yes gene_type:complete
MKSKNNKTKSYLKIIKQIEKVRAKNNKNWMDLYRLAFKSEPEKSVNIVKKILSKDKNITKLVNKLTK